jgi:hypothetical protein
MTLWRPPRLRLAKWRACMVPRRSDVVNQSSKGQKRKKRERNKSLHLLSSHGKDAGSPISSSAPVGRWPHVRKSAARRSATPGGRTNYVRSRGGHRLARVAWIHTHIISARNLFPQAHRIERSVARGQEIYMR